VPVTLLSTLFKLKSLLAHCAVPLALLAGDRALAHDEGSHTLLDDVSSDVSCSRCNVAAASELVSSSAAVSVSSSSSSSGTSSSSSSVKRDAADAVRVLCDCFEPPSIGPQDDCFAMPVDFGAVRYDSYHVTLSTV
jgi:hypothetical protein